MLLPAIDDHSGTRIPRSNVDLPSLPRRLLVAAILITFHLQIFPRAPIPFIIPIVCTLGLFLLNFRRLPARPVVLLIFAWLIAIVCAVLAPRSAFLQARLVSTIYLMISMSVGFLVYVEVGNWPSRLIARWTIVGALILLIGGTLEVLFPPVLDLTHAYRAWNLEGSVSAQQSMRDLGLYGITRPTFFSMEPSFLAKHFSLLLMMWLFVSEHPRRLIISGGLTVFAFVIMRSPTLVLLLVILTTYMFFDRKKTTLVRFSFGAKFALAAWAAPAAVIVIATLAYANFGARIDSMLLGQDASTSIRITGSFAVVDDLLAFNPLSGLGVGGVDAFVFDVIYPYFSQIPSSDLDAKLEAGAIQLMNGPANFIVAFGIVGGILMAAVLRRLQEALAPGTGMSFWPIFIFFSLTIGAFNGVRMWLVFFLMLVALKKTSKLVHN